jgi:hypothetical protein
VYSGKYSVKLVTGAGAGHLIPGLLTTGTVDVTTQNVVGGILISSRPLYLNGWYQFLPAGADTGNAQIILIKGDSVIGQGSVNFTGTVNTWTAFSVPVTYTSASTPDTVQITFNSSATNTPIQKTVLILDELSYSYTTGINDNEIQPVRLYPNPAHNVVALDNGAMQAKTANLYNADGQLVKVYSLHEGTNQLNIANLATGIYTISAIGYNGSVYRSKVSVQ